MWSRVQRRLDGADAPQEGRPDPARRRPATGRRRGLRWTAAPVVVALAVGAAAIGELDPPVAGARAVPPEGRPLATFVSMPDFLNADIGDTRARAGRGWEPGDPNSINASWRRAIDVVLDQVKSERPDFVLVAGDLVEGHWGRDADQTGIFGPVGTRAQKLAAVTNAGNLYYSQWARRFSSRNLNVHPAVGDHEIGDNPWPAGTFKHVAVPTYKRVWAKHFTTYDGKGHRYAMRPVGTPYEDTAYAFRFGRTLFVSVDVYKHTSQGVRVTVSGGQLRWLDRLITTARAEGVKHVIVQGHTPVLGPVRARHSSNMLLEGGASSPFWKLLKRRKVDLYLTGEAHDMTTLTDGVVQVTHGALENWGQENYLLGRIYPDRIELTLKEFRGSVTNFARLWATTHKRPHRGVSFERGVETVGTLVIDKSGDRRRLLDRSGRLRNYH